MASPLLVLLLLSSPPAAAPAEPPAALTPEALREALTTGGSSNYRKTVRYDLEAHLDPEAKEVTAAGRILWTNHGSRPVRALWWHLYLNAFKNDRTTFMIESNGGELRGDAFDREHWGWVEVTKLVATPPAREGEPAVPANILLSRTFEQPDDGNRDDQTVMRTPLPFAVEPGETVELDIAFVSRLPKVFARSGWSGSFFMVAQWFPKLGVLEETFTGDPGDAEEPAWNCHQYHATSEYFADYGEYHVAIDVPEAYVVGATGVRVATERPVPGRVTYVYDIEKVHDFAWTADTRFVEIERDFVAAKEVPFLELEEVADMLGLEPPDVELSDVKVRLLVQPEHAQYADRYFRAVFAGLKWFGLWYGAYPYPVLTVVDGPRGAGGAMGMEYPTLITGGVRWPAAERGSSPEMVTIHEFGHQYWYGLVGSNEFEESWLDEGFNTYSTGKVADEVFGSFQIAPRFLGLPLTPWFPNTTIDQATVARVGTMMNPDDDAVVRRAWEFRSVNSYGINSYPRSALTLLQLENVVGEATLLRAMRVYHLRWRYRHPRTEDFVRAVEEVHGKPLSAWFERTIHTPDGVDFSVDALKSEKRKTAAGVFDPDDAEPGSVAHVEVTKEAAKKEDGEAEEDAVYDTTVYVRRETNVDFPVTVEVTFEDGTTEIRTWDGAYRWARFDFETKSRAKHARLHPYDGYPIDLRRANDSKRTKKERRPGVVWGAHVLYTVQTLWQILGGLL